MGRFNLKHTIMKQYSISEQQLEDLEDAVKYLIEFNKNNVLVSKQETATWIHVNSRLAKAIINTVKKQVLN